jgi:hypothetical protein
MPFLIQHEPDYYFSVGTCSDGRQALMGLLCPFLVTYFFDAHGSLLGSDYQPWNYPAPRQSPDKPYHTHDPQFKEAFAQQEKQWQEALGFQAGTIQIEAFWDEENYVGIRLLPDWLAEEPEEDPEERAFWEEQLANWQTSGMFVLWWGNNYNMNADGSIESS